MLFVYKSIYEASGQFRIICTVPISCDFLMGAWEVKIEHHDNKKTKANHIRNAADTIDLDSSGAFSA